jgi:hypothetical protein
MIKFPAQYRAETGPRLQPTGRGGLPCAVGRKAGWATAWQPSLAGQTACAARCNARAPTQSPRADRAQDVAVAYSPAARRWLNGGKVLPEISRGPQGRCRQGGEGRGAPERRVDGEVGGEFRDGSIQRWGGSSGGRGRVR